MTNQRVIKNEISDQKKVHHSHRQFVKVVFDSGDMDFTFQWLLGTSTEGGLEIGEAFYTASQIKDGDPESWEQEWLKMAQRVEARADKSFKDNHIVSARESYLRAANYYRAILASMLPDNPKFMDFNNKLRTLFKKAGTLFNPQIQYIEIPFEKTVLPGYFICADNSREKRKTLIMIGGGETYAEDLYFYNGSAANKRGYNFLTVDLPGQGWLPAEGYYFRPDTEVPMKAVVDYALSRPEVDPERLAAYGISGGGYFVPRAVCYDKRIKALVANSIIPDLYGLWANTPVKGTEDKEVLKKWDSFKVRMTALLAWRWGLGTDNIFGLIEANKDFVFDPSMISCPTIILSSEGEYVNPFMQGMQTGSLEKISNNKKQLVVTPMNEGASSHCVGENRSLMSQIVFDFLDEVFE